MWMRQRGLRSNLIIMKFKIYQSYFEESQIPRLDPEFSPMSNIGNPLNHLREYPILKNCYQDAVEKELDVWGLISYRWRDKIMLNPQTIMDHVANNPGYDVYILNPYAELETVTYNVWEQGHWFNPLLLEISKELLPAIGLDPDLVYQPMATDHVGWCCYFLGTREFWNEWFELIERYTSVLPYLSQSTQDLHNTKVIHGDQNDMDHFPFMHEALFSTFMLANQDRFRIKTFTPVINQLSEYSNMLRMMKMTAVHTRDKSLLKEWNRLRAHSDRIAGPLLGTGWIDKLNFT